MRILNSKLISSVVFPDKNDFYILLEVAENSQEELQEDERLFLSNYASRGGVYYVDLFYIVWSLGHVLGLFYAVDEMCPAYVIF